ncbi:hypothetical protein RB195_018755 [Necator americanus]|uniref:Rx N-terminal domain-containing protein n=1 Tax=Necator americanus TaxID=51031 RepID=A0ABR1CC79_NECAM
MSSPAPNRSGETIGWLCAIARDIEKAFEAPLRMLRSEQDRLVEERKVFEDLFNESERKNRALRQLMRVADDLHALRRIMPLAAREVRFSRVSDWTIMKEETVLSYLVREEVERTMIEIQRDRTVKVTVIIKEIMKSCVLVNTRLGDYKCWPKGKEDKSPWRGDKPEVSLSFGELWLTNHSETADVPSDLRKMFLRSTIKAAIFGGFSNVGGLHAELEEKGCLCPT